MSTQPDLPVCRMTALPSVLPSYFMTRTQQFTTGVVRTLVTALRNLICLANSCCQAVIGHVYCLARMFGFDCWDVNHDGTAVSQRTNNCVQGGTSVYIVGQYLMTQTTTAYRLPLELTFISGHQNKKNQIQTSSVSLSGSETVRHKSRTGRQVNRNSVSQPGKQERTGGIFPCYGGCPRFHQAIV